MGLSEAWIMQQVDGNKNLQQRICSTLDKKVNNKMNQNSIETIPTNMQHTSTKNLILCPKTEENFDLKLSQIKNDDKGASHTNTQKKLNVKESFMKNINCNSSSELDDASSNENTRIKSNEMIRHSKHDANEIQQNKDLGHEKQTKASEKIKYLCDDNEVKLCSLVKENLKENQQNCDINTSEKPVSKEICNCKAGQCATQREDIEKENISKEKEVKMPEKCTIKEGKVAGTEPTETDGNVHSIQDKKLSILEKKLSEIHINLKPQLTKEITTKNIKGIQKLLLKLKIKEPADTEATKNTLQSPENQKEGEDLLIERSPIEQSFVNAPLQSGSTVTQDSSEIQHSDVLFSILRGAVDSSTFSDVDLNNDVMQLYISHPEYFDDILASLERDNASSIGISNTEDQDILIPEPVLDLNTHLSDSPQTFTTTSPQSDSYFSPVSSPNNPEYLQYVPSTPNALSMVSSVPSPSSFFHPDSPQNNIHSQELEKFSKMTSDNLMYVQELHSNSDLKEQFMVAGGIGNQNSAQCNMDTTSVSSNEGTMPAAGIILSTNAITSVQQTANMLHISSNYFPEYQETDSLPNWYSDESSSSFSTSTDISCTQQQALLLGAPQAVSTLPLSNSFLNTNSTISNTGGSRILDVIKEAPSLPSTIPISAKSRLEKILNPKVKVDAIINIWKIPDSLIAEGDKNGDTQLMILVSKKVPNQYELVHALVERLKNMPGNPLETVNENGESAQLLSSVLLPDCPLIARYIAETLLEKGANLDKGDKYGKSPLHYLAENGKTHLKMLTELMSLKDANNHSCFNVNKSCEEGTPLHIAVRNHQIGVGFGNQKVDCASTVQFLISQGADVHAKDSQGHNALHLAIRGACDPCLVQILLRTSSELVNTMNSNGDTALHLAAMRNDIPLQRQVHVMRMLVSFGACTNIIGSNGRVPLGLVSPERKNEIGQILHRR